jgi:beta-lactamase regulating signal transducer with metallopeptidase domain
MSAALFSLLVAASIRASLVAALVLGVLRLARIRSTAMRHGAWTAVVVAMLAMPLLPSIIPAAGVASPIPAVHERGRLEHVEAATLTEPEVAIPVTPSAAAPARSGVVPIESARPSLGQRPRIWQASFVAIYLVGVVVLLSRFAIGIVGMRRILRQSTPLELSGIGHAAVSASVAAPLTAGMLTPTIVLPTAWTSWPAEQLAAVLAHERAHIVRRDPLVRSLAYVNRSLFWFHPLAWWLERQLALTSEQACDDAAVRAAGRPARYAEILLDLATAVARHGGRIAWPALGIHGEGHLARRIERILRGELLPGPTRAQKSLVGIGCALAIVLPVACRRDAAPPALKPDPTIAARLALRRSAQERYDAAVAMTAQDVEAAEATLQQTPENIELRQKLVVFYDNRGQQALGWNRMVVARRRHVLWSIDQHPESELAASRDVSPAIDPEGYAQAKRLWLAYVQDPQASPAVLSHAATFFSVADKPIAERVLLRLLEADPTGPQPRIQGDTYFPSWTERLGELYARAIVGSNDDTLFNVVRSVSAAEAPGPLAGPARKGLAGTTDAVLLEAAGRYLVINARGAAVDFDRVALGRSYLDRTLQIDPSSRAAREIVAILENGARRASLLRAVTEHAAAIVGGDVLRKVQARDRLTGGDRRVLEAVEEQALSQLSAADRFALLPELAAERYMDAEALDYTRHDTAAANAAWSQSRRYAEQTLALAPMFQNSPDYGAAVRSARLTLGTHALREGDRKTAVRYLSEAGAVKVSADAPRDMTLESRLTNYLLDSGERESVAAYLEHVAPENPRTQQQRLTDVAAIRAGRMPLSYQYMMTPH